MHNAQALHLFISLDDLTFKSNAEIYTIGLTV